MAKNICNDVMARLNLGIGNEISIPIIGAFIPNLGDTRQCCCYKLNYVPGKGIALA